MKNINTLKQYDYFLMGGFLLLGLLALPAVKMIVVLLPLMALGALSTFRFQEKRWPDFKPFRPIIALALGFMGLGLISYFWSDAPCETAVRFVKFLIPIGSFLILLPIIRETLGTNDKRPFYNKTIIASFCLIFLCFLFDNTGTYHQGKPYVIFVFMGLPALVALYSFVSNRLYHALITLIALIAMCCVTPASSMLAPQLFYLGLAISSLVLVLRLPARLIISLMSIGFITSFLLLFIALPFKHDTLMTTYKDVAPPSVMSRIEIWNLAIERGLERPILGHGWDSSSTIEDRGEVSYLYDTPTSIIHNHPHNTLVQIFYELGGVGIFITILFLGFLITTIWQRTDRNETIKSFLVLQLGLIYLSSLTSFSAWQGWFVSAVCFASLISYTLTLSSGRSSRG